MKLLLILLSAISLMACNGKEQSLVETVNNVTDKLYTSSKTTLYLQPFDNFSQVEAKRLKADIEKHREEFGPVSIQEIVILPNKPLTDELKNDAKTRYRADKIIPELRKQINHHTAIIGLTHKDISVSHNGKKDWGIIGLAFLDTRACVISTHRMWNKSEFWKVAVHEFCHAYYGAPHCPMDNPHCILQDAKGKYTFGRSPSLCEYCRTHL